MPLTPAHIRLLRALGKAAAQAYLQEQRKQAAANDPPPKKRAPLLPERKSA